MYICKNILSDILFRFKWKMSDRELSFKGRCFSKFQNLSNCNLVIYLNLRIVQHWQQEILWIGVFLETIYLKLWNPLEYCKMKWYQPLAIKLLKGESALKALLSWNNIVVILMYTLMSFNSSKDKNIFLESQLTKIRWILWFLRNLKTKCRGKYWKMAVNLASKNQIRIVLDNFQSFVNFGRFCLFLPFRIKGIM